MSKKIDKNLIVCAQNKCLKCGIGEEVIPKGCKFAILHCLEPFKIDGGIHEKPRQSGKTTQLMRIADKLECLGMPVYFVTRTRDFVEYVKQNQVYGRCVKLLSLSTLSCNDNNPPGYILTDELSPIEVEVVRSRLPGSRFLVGYYTSWG